ncbi:Cytochrome p450 [Thalictrum thalictroides]|uniref:Cytochrome p450 n=1 Tax=Thalictrum thalictroides TaxID=46969 RepID=A0A7J6VYT8_THATH|nr:Cytochrome p450 [Thalictrum thalictroides]
MEETNFYILILLLVLFVSFLVLHHLRQKFSKYPPGPYPLPILGNFLHLHKAPHIALANLAKVHGPLISLRLGAKLLIVASSQEAATEILKVHERAMSGRPVPLTIEAVGSKGLDFFTLIGATSCTKNWKKLRTIVKAELLSTDVVDKTTIVREEKAKELIDLLSSKQGQVVNLGDFIFTTAANTLSRLLFSKDFISLENESLVGGFSKENIKTIVNLASTPNIGDHYTIFSGLDIQGLGKKSAECLGRLYASWNNLVSGRQETKCGDHVNKDKDFLDVLLANGFSKDQINLILSEMLITGIDTTSAAVEWAMAELIKNQDAMTKLSEELAKEIGGNIIRDSDLPRLPYLNACVKETLRLHPSVAMVPRRAIERCQVMNYTIPKNAEIWVNLWALGRDPTKWEVPLAFMPSRFLQSHLSFMGSHFEYIPFGSGRRMCPGLPLAVRLVPLVIASLVHSFDWYLPDNLSPSELNMDAKLGLTLQREKPLYLIPRTK